MPSEKPPPNGRHPTTSIPSNGRNNKPRDPRLDKRRMGDNALRDDHRSDEKPFDEPPEKRSKEAVASEEPVGTPPVANTVVSRQMTPYPAQSAQAEAAYSEVPIGTPPPTHSDNTFVSRQMTTAQSAQAPAQSAQAQAAHQPRPLHNVMLNQQSSYSSEKRRSGEFAHIGDHRLPEKRNNLTGETPKIRSTAAIAPEDPNDQRRNQMERQRFHLPRAHSLSNTFVSRQQTLYPTHSASNPAQSAGDPTQNFIKQSHSLQNVMLNQQPPYSSNTRRRGASAHTRDHRLHEKRNKLTGETPKIRSTAAIAPEEPNDQRRNLKKRHSFALPRAQSLGNTVVSRQQTRYPAQSVRAETAQPQNFKQLEHLAFGDTPEKVSSKWKNPTVADHLQMRQRFYRLLHSDFAKPMVAKRSRVSIESFPFGLQFKTIKLDPLWMPFKYHSELDGSERSQTNHCRNAVCCSFGLSFVNAIKYPGNVTIYIDRCSFCKGAHPPVGCTTVCSVNLRRRECHRRRLCIACTNPLTDEHHATGSCQNPRRGCKFCKADDHDTSMCHSPEAQRVMANYFHAIAHLFYEKTDDYRKEERRRFKDFEKWGKEFQAWQESGYGLGIALDMQSDSNMVDIATDAPGIWGAELDRLAAIGTPWDGLLEKNIFPFFNTERCYVGEDFDSWKERFFHQEGKKGEAYSRTGDCYMSKITRMKRRPLSAVSTFQQSSRASVLNANNIAGFQHQRFH